MKKLSEYTIIGKIINTRGIKGELKIYPITSVISRFSDLTYLYLGEELIKLDISNVSYDNRFVYLKFKGYDNINDVLEFKDKYLYIDDDNRIELDEDTFFVSDIIGCRVYDMNNIKLGTVKSVIENPVNDLYVVINDSGEFLLPAVSRFIKKIDIIEKSIFIDPIEGLIN